MQPSESPNNPETAVEAVRADPSDHEAWYALGRFLALQGEKDRARECFTRAIRLDPTARPANEAKPPPPELPAWL